ncbi:hypothetical protein [Rhizobium sp. LjRoot254]|uniref:hypothetical protein n=1 Tax=Rhizobium sp. LjRoot254 TaxID=3342297 RepID=UPI003ECF2994
MKRNLSILQRATAADLQLDPYPHVVIPNALPDDLYAELEASFPKPEAMGIKADRNNHRWNYASRKIRRNKNLPQVWRDFIAYHASEDFYHDIINVFYEGIHALYPERFPNRQSLEKLRVGMRKHDTFADRDVLMDAMISGNTPVTEASSVRSSHLDSGDKLFSGLFYMRPKTYDAIGGDLTISRYNRDLSGKPERHGKFKGAYIEDDNLDVVRTVPYDRNLAVIFINSLDSVHGVTVREPSPHSRLFVNLVGEIDPPLYMLEDAGKPAHYLPANQPRTPIGLTDRIVPMVRRMFG